MQGNYLGELAIHAQLTQRAYWVATYRDREPVDERACGWDDVPHHGMTSLHLVTPVPNLVIGVGDAPDAEGRLFQLKTAMWREGRGSSELGVVIGMLRRGSDDECVCYAWEYASPQGPRLIGPFKDSFHRMAYRPPGLFPLGCLSAAVLGVGSDR